MKLSALEMEVAWKIVSVGSSFAQCIREIAAKAFINERVEI